MLNIEVESSMTSLASRVHFEVLGLGVEAQVLDLEAYKSFKTSCPLLEDSIISWLDEKENNQTKTNLNF